MRFFYYLVIVSFFFASCQRVPDTIEPRVNYAVQDKYLQSLPSAFPPLTAAEQAQPFGQEMLIGMGFAKELDLYQALTAFKRAEFLLPEDKRALLGQIQYEILLCYYMGKKFDEVLYTFEHSQLRYVDASFPAFHDLLLILHETYSQLKMDKQRERLFPTIANAYPEEAEKLQITRALSEGDLEQIKQEQNNYPYLSSLLQHYRSEKKHVATAQGLNALLPGAGYLYLGQKQSALTAFLLNGLFIGASVYFFEQGNIPAGAIFTSFEAGWYFGGIYGAGLEAKAYNERLYETLATPVMMKEKLFPGLMVHYAF